MVICTQQRLRRQTAALMVEMMVAIALLVVAILPLGYSIIFEKHLARVYYDRAVAMEIVDGEMEVLMDGGWKAFGPGTHPYTVDARSAANLPPGQFLITVKADRVRLQWLPANKHHGGPVVREAVLAPMSATNQITGKSP